MEKRNNVVHLFIAETKRTNRSVGIQEYDLVF